MAGDLIAGRYRLLETLGRGAMSSVWLARDEELGRQVAVKTLAPSADRARFEREARAAAALSHPNICSVYDYGEADGKPFMVLEYLPNGSLEDLLAAGAPGDDDALRIATELAAGLAHAHERGLVHRDLKPANVLFDVEGRAKIADFGIARMGNTVGLTEAGTVLGTASYISPEQAAGRPAGPASDVYSFGVILFRMLTGRLPFVSANAMELVRMHRDDEPPTVGSLRGDAPVRLERIADEALAKDPAARPADGAALLRELRGTGDPTLVTGPGAFPTTVTTAATQVLQPAAAPGRRRVPVVPLIAALVVLLGGGVALALTLGDDGGGASPPATSLPALSLPSVPSATTAPATTAASTSTEVTTTAPTTTTRPTTTTPVTTAPPTTAPATTAPATTVPTTTQPTTTVSPTTTAPATTTATTTDTTPTTTATP